MGQGTIPEVRDRWGILPEVRDGSGDPRGGLGRVRGPYLKSGMVRVFLPKVRGGSGWEALQMFRAGSRDPP